MTALRATDTTMPTAEDTVEHNPMRPPADSPRSFIAAVREFWSHLSPLVLLATVLSLAALRWQAGPAGWRDLLLALGVWALFPFNEWLIHRFVLHFRPRRVLGVQVDFYLPKTHRRHHAEPWNLAWVFVPRHVYALILPPMALAVWLSGSWRAELLSVFLTYMLLGLHYEWAHYLTHVTWCPPLAYYQRRVLEHRWHHFRNENYWWGVSMGLGDRVFGTAPNGRETARSGSNRDLGIKR